MIYEISIVCLWMGKQYLWSSIDGFLQKSRFWIDFCSKFKHIDQLMETNSFVVMLVFSVDLQTFICSLLLLLCHSPHISSIGCLIPLIRIPVIPTLLRQQMNWIDEFNHLLSLWCQLIEESFFFLVSWLCLFPIYVQLMCCQKIEYLWLFQI